MSSQQKILHIAGWSTCGFFRKTTNILSSLATLFPSRLCIIDHAFPSRDAYRAWLIEGGFRDHFSDKRAKSHTSSPFVWRSSSLLRLPPEDESKVIEFVGGHDDSIMWCRTFLAPTREKIFTSNKIMLEDGYNSKHPYEYDLVVIGGGSGGLAASKEASNRGAGKVVLLDYVKPTPIGSTWGLGGTCVNVGCIPKKLMHHASMLRESLIFDSKSFGLLDNPDIQHSWKSLRQNIQNHIRGLNFKYRVSLRENNITYLNKCGKFRDAHTIEVTDKKGQVSTITSSRFLIAVGGRPTPLSCEGGELAISSDDLFSLENSPGKTLCVGASYISLECAGFLAGLGFDVTVAVRSILLRGFDRECAEKIGSYMEGHGVHFKKKVVPIKLEKNVENGLHSGQENGKILVTFSDGSRDRYNTVLAAIGRTADTKNLGLETLGLTTNPKNGKIETLHEQTQCSNVYAVGDVVEGCPELTPVAIQAGVLLSRRLFGNSLSREYIDYRNVCTTVFTPIEYGTVGFSEEDALEAFGNENIEVYHKNFLPLEWSLTESRSNNYAFTKVIVDKSDNDKVIGLHFLGPNAGEVVQGYGVALKKGITFPELQETVGIHPTNAEEVVTLKISKSSGINAKAAGC